MLHPTILAATACILLPQLARASPLPAVTPLVRLVARQAVETATELAEATEQPTVTDSSITSDSTQRPWRGPSSFRGNQQNNDGSPMLSAVTIGLISAVVAILLLSRLYYVLRYYPFSARAFFVPPSGISLGCVRIDPAKPHPPTGPPPAYSRGNRVARQRRGVQVDGLDVGEGGVRMGQRDEDDTWDGDERGGAEAPPKYALDLDLPGYNYRNNSANQAGLEAEQRRREEEETLPSAQAYEAATRVRRAQPSRTNSMQASSEEPMEMQERGRDVPETVRRHSTAGSTSSGSTASSSATKVEDLEAAEEGRNESKPEEERIEDAGAVGDLGEMEMTSRVGEPVSVRRSE